MELLALAHHSVPKDIINLPTSFSALLTQLVGSDRKFGYSTLRVNTPGPVPRQEGDIVVGFYALTPATMSLSAGGLTWDSSVPAGQGVLALKNILPYPLISAQYSDLIITKITGEVLVIYCSFMDVTMRRRLAYYAGKVCDGVYVASGVIYNSEKPITFIENI
jgi:hypothetical protein